MNKIKIILSYILGFLLSLCILLLAIAFICKSKVTSKPFTYRIMDENDYYSKVYNSICEDIENYMMSSGLENDVLDGVISKNKVEKDIRGYTDSLYSGNKYEVDTSEINNKLKSNINNYLKGMNLGIDNTNELDLFVSDIEKIYKKEVSFYNTIDILSGLPSRIVNKLDKVIKLDIIAIVVIGVILILFKVINIGSCILSSGIMLFLLKLFIYERVDSQNILIVSDHFSLIIRSMFKYISEYMINVSIILVCFGFILTLFSNKKKMIEKTHAN